MPRPVLSIKGYTPEKIRALLRTDERYTVGMRLYAVYLVATGQPSRKLEELYKVSFKQITNWVHRFEKEGTDGLIDKDGRGRKPRLTKKQSEELRQVLNESPTKHGFDNTAWSGPMVMEWMKNNFGIEYKKAQVYNILKTLGFRYYKGRGILPEANQKYRKSSKRI